MVLAFQNFKDVSQLSERWERHKAWLKDYEGKIYSIAKDGNHLFKWATEKRMYSDKFWKGEINMLQELGNRIRIEFDDKDKDGNKNKEIIEKNINLVLNKIKENKWGYILSTHKGYSNYIWLEFNRILSDKEKQSFLIWIAPEGSQIDLNFASSKKVYPVLFAEHWKYSFNTEDPIDFFEGEQINYDSLGIVIKDETKKIKKVRVKNKSFEYVTGIKKASKIFTTSGQVEKFNELQPIFYDRNGIFWLWNNNDKCWEITDEVDILNMIEKNTGKDIITPSKRTEIINSLKQEGRLNIPKPIKKTWIQFKDTIVDVVTGEEIKATPEYFVTNPIPWKLHNDRFIETPVMDKIFEEWVGKEKVKLLYEILAYSLLPDYPIHRLFCFIGEGMNGKSCFLRLLTNFVGEENTTATELDTLISSRFEITRLYKKLVVIMGETNFAEMSKTSIIKKLTGQDRIGFEYKNKNPFDDYNYAKILIATNNLPTTTDKTIGFYRRWCIIDFPNHFSEKKMILDDIPEEEYECLTVKCLGILKDLLENKSFTNEGTIEERAKKYEDHSDPLEKFMKENTEEDLNGFIWKFDFEKKFNSWCEENRFRKFSEDSIGKKMKEKNIESDRRLSDWLIDGSKKQLRCWVGIKWKE